MPSRVAFSITEGGRIFREVGAVENTTPPQQWGAVIALFAVPFAPAWIFVDEIAVR